MTADATTAALAEKNIITPWEDTHSDKGVTQHLELAALVTLPPKSSQHLPSLLLLLDLVPASDLVGGSGHMEF